MLDRLTPEEQHALLELLMYMAKSDGRVMDVEEEILQQYADLVEVDFDTIDGGLTPSELIPRFISPVSRMIALQELLRLSHLDGYFANDEQAAIYDIAEQMRIPQEYVAELDEWVVDGLRWMMRGEDLLDQAEELEV